MAFAHEIAAAGRGNGFGRMGRGVLALGAMGRQSAFPSNFVVDDTLHLGAVFNRGRKRALIGGAGIGAMGLMHHQRSSARNGLQGRSSGGMM